MTTYIYETIPQHKGDPVLTFEIKQSMRDEALTKHPETGQPIRRIITGGFGIIGANSGKSCSNESCEHNHNSTCSCCH